MNIFKLICLICIIALHGKAYGAPAGEDLALLAQLKSKDADRRMEAILKIHSKGKAAIPLLLDHLGDCEDNLTLELRFNDPSSSQILPVQGDYNCIGVVYAYTIELILAGGELKPIMPGSVAIEIKGRHCSFYAYPVGLILTQEENALTPQQMAEVKKIYQDWYEKNKDKTIEQLRLDWDAKMRPLSGSAYHWR